MTDRYEKVFREEYGVQLRQNHGIELSVQPVNLVQSLMQQSMLQRPTPTTYIFVTVHTAC